VEREIDQRRGEIPPGRLNLEWAKLAKKVSGGSVLRQVVGGQEDEVYIDIHSQVVPLEPGDRLLLSTDGLTDPLEDEEKTISKILGNQTLSTEQATQALMDAAQQGRDNRTAVVVDIKADVSGEQDAVTVPAGLEEFQTVEAFLSVYGDQAGGLESVGRFPQAAQVWVLPPAPPVNLSMIAYTHPEWVDPVADQLQSEFIITVPYPANGQIESQSVVVWQKGAKIASPNPSAPVLQFQSLEELKSRLTPGLVHAVVINQILVEKGTIWVVGTLTFTDAEGNIRHALFV
jgi:hypothetical protein